MELVLPDTLTGRPRAVRRKPGRPVALYVCGPTVYDAAHVGHGRNYLVFDVARRFLEAEGIPVRHVMNITDFEDKLDARAEELGVSWRALARREERAFLRDLAALHLLLPQLTPRATEYVPRMVEVARRLMRTGRVYRDGNEWTYTPPHRAAGKNFPTDRQLAAHAVSEPGHPFPESAGRAGAFMIWRLQRPPKPSWPSPWGPGIPGWHLECYAMADRLLGLPVDLHGGGLDLIYPHHYAENEIALEFRGRPFSHVFLHVGFVLIDGSKMSKSRGALVPLRTALNEVGADALRWYLLSTPPTERLPWSPVELARSRAEFLRVRDAVRHWMRASAGGRDSAASARRLAADVRRELARGLATDRAFRRLSAWATTETERGGAVARTDRARARAAFRDIEARTGLRLL